MEKENSFCPVCGYNLGFPAWKDGLPSDEVCSSCGIQFGYTDAAGGDKEKRIDIHKKWCEDWIRTGMIWNGNKDVKPKDWNPKEQLKNVSEGFK